MSKYELKERFSEVTDYTNNLTCMVFYLIYSVYGQTKAAEVWTLFLPCPGAQIASSAPYFRKLSACPLSTADHVLHPYKIRGNIIAFYILIFTFSDSRQENNNPEPNGIKRSPNLICSLISSVIEILISVVSICLKVFTVAKDLLNCVWICSELCLI